MKSLELLRKLNEDPALRVDDGIPALRLATRVQTLLELRKLDPAAVPSEDGERLFLELSGLTADEKRREELYGLRAVVDAAERVVEAWERVGSDDAGAIDFDDLAQAAIEEMDALREAVADVKRQAAIAAEMGEGRR